MALSCHVLYITQINNTNRLSWHEEKAMFQYYNIGLQRFKTAGIKNFTSDFGLRFRRFINRPFRAVLNIATPGKIIIESYPKLEKGEA